MKNTIMFEVAACGKDQTGFSAFAYVINEEIAQIVIKAMQKRDAFYKNANYRTRQIIMDTTVFTAGSALVEA